MKASVLPGFETLVKGPADAHILISVIDDLAVCLYAIQVLTEDAEELGLSPQELLKEIAAIAKEGLSAED